MAQELLIWAPTGDRGRSGNVYRETVGYKAEQVISESIRKGLDLVSRRLDCGVGYSFCAEESCDLCIHVDHVRIVKSSDSNAGLCIVLVGQIT